MIKGVNADHDATGYARAMIDFNALDSSLALVEL